MSLIVGTYRVSTDAVPDLISEAKSLGICHFDTAQLYKNEASVVAACDDGDTITTKVFDTVNTRQQLRRRIKRSQHHFSARPASKNVMLIHNPVPNEFWKELVESHDGFEKVGISNYDLASLKNLLRYCDEEGLAYPHIHQMEVHPFVDCGKVIQLCKESGIQIQGHSCLVQGKCFGYGPLIKIAFQLGTSPAAVLLQWALGKDIPVCIKASNPKHLAELVHASGGKLPPAVTSEMDIWCQEMPIRLYNRGSLVPRTLTPIQNQDEYVDQCVRQLKEDADRERPSILCEQLPSYCNLPIARLLAAALFPDKTEEQRPTLYRAFLKQLRTKRINSNLTDKLSKKGLFCVPRRRLDGPYDDHILHPRPMPVTVTSPTEFKPILEFVKSSETVPQSDTIFVKGAIFPDGRLDLCKQVVGDTSIQTLCKTVQQSKCIKHFLLGNNVAFEYHGEEGAQAMAAVMADPTVAIETWYLAGNCIGPKEISILSESLHHNQVCKALWLKRNPIMSDGCIHLNRMLTVNRTLVLLDLHNCGIGNEGVKNLLQNPEQLSTLKHLYLDANAIEPEGLKYVSAWCKQTQPVTLYLSINRLGDSAIQHLCESLINSPKLKRLCLASSHLGDKGVKSVVELAKTCPKLKCLNLGCYKSTADLGEHPGNFFTDASLPVLTDLLLNCSSLEYLNTGGCKMSKQALLQLPRLERVSMDLGAGPWHHPHPKDTLRYVKQPRRVIHIDSIYRGKM